VRPPRPASQALVVLALAAGGCEVPLAPPAVQRQAVVGGALEPGFSAVGALVASGALCAEPPEAARVRCTGTLVAPRAVLTAAHCVENLELARGLTVVFAPEVGAALPTERVRAAGGWVHPGWSPGVNDVAVLILAEDAPGVPIPLEGVALSQTQVGQVARVVGFGMDEQERLGARRSGTARVAKIEAGTFSLAAAPGMSCGGDSGGPVFLEVDGAERLAGITSYGNTACTTGTNMRVDVQVPLLQEVLAQAARAPGTRAPFDPEVDACTLRCEGHGDCPLGMACVSQPGGERSCALAGLEAGHFGEACTGTDANELCVKAGEVCRQWVPCATPEPQRGGCTATNPGGAGGLAAALLVLGARLLNRRAGWRR
jgi:V8-like Glu-specific endopeptidase